MVYYCSYKKIVRSILGLTHDRTVRTGYLFDIEKEGASAKSRSAVLPRDLPHTAHPGRKPDPSESPVVIWISPHEAAPGSQEPTSGADDYLEVVVDVEEVVLVDEAPALSSASTKVWPPVSPLRGANPREAADAIKGALSAATARTREKPRFILIHSKRTFSIFPPYHSVGGRSPFNRYADMESSRRLTHAEYPMVGMRAIPILYIRAVAAGSSATAGRSRGSSSSRAVPRRRRCPPAAAPCASAS